MKKEKLTKERKSILQEKLNKLMYRKAALEHDIMVRLKGANIYSKYIDALQNKKTNSIEDRDILQLKSYKAVIKTREYISVYKELKREYDYSIVPSISEIVEELGLKMDDAQVIDFDKRAKEMVDQTKIDAVEVLPSNVELPEVIESFNDMIELTKKVISAAKEKTVFVDDLQRAENEMIIFKEELRLKALQRRQDARVKYYTEDFLPKYEAEMKEAEQLLPAYLKRAKLICQTGIDLKLCSMLEQYESHKEDNEKLWLFYTALKKRVEEIRNHILLNRESMNKFINLANPIENEQQPNKPVKKSTVRAKAKK